jgi:hypothetical protein
MRNVNETLRKTTGLEIGKWIARSTVGLWTIKDEILWWGWHPPKEKTRATGRNVSWNQAQPTEDGDIPLGYSGRTDLGREQCDIWAVSITIKECL